MPLAGVLAPALGCTDMPAWHQLLDVADHRPYALPARPWHMTMSWRELLFAHWSFPPEQIAACLPAGLELDTFEGRAWLGIVPFRMTHVGPRGLPYMPGLSAFPELNVRTYVIADGKPGVWFFSLDAANYPAVKLARTGFYLPYYHARMHCKVDADAWVDYRSERTHRGAPAGGFVGRYRPIGDVFLSQPGTLDQWLTERYCLYAQDRRGRIRRGEIHHAPWPLQRAEANIELCSVSDGWGLPLPEEAPLLHYVERIDVVAWLLERP